jgi:hypothetical protein
MSKNVLALVPPILAVVVVLLSLLRRDQTVNPELVRDHSRRIVNHSWKYGSESPARKQTTHTVVMIPSPIQWSDRRARVNEEFVRGKWNRSQVVLVYILGTKTGARLEANIDYTTAMDTEIKFYGDEIQYVFSRCRDYGDERNNPNGTSATTCKVYEGFKHVSANYDSQFVWRGADDSYLNLHMWFRVAPQLPPGHLYFGSLRYVDRDADLALASQPLLQDAFAGLTHFGPYMVGMGFMVSASVADFIGTLKIPPKQVWCEDVMVGMWLLPFQVTWLQANRLGFPMLHRVDAVPVAREGMDVLLTHYMQAQDWQTIDDDGVIRFSEADDSLASILSRLSAFN